MNSLHIEDYDDKSPLGQAILFIAHVFVEWRASVPNLTLTSIVSADEYSVVVKFHVKRLTEQWINENIDSYEDPIMSVESSEDVVQVVAALSH
ncbi:hypothetical protein [Pandoraea sp. SD6-2]|uniref:hypothetical protein n=1 Tax=Pandoraea sp. SD6-2 TaxID=1286093 RepID=UPI00032E1273|nr:hypothetical protein [Pandoraea sp. SD6-2]EON12799.1 hypothetical protein C266_15517 [Pandoraea sp. SD6-2]